MISTLLIAVYVFIGLLLAGVAHYMYDDQPSNAVERFAITTLFWLPIITVTVLFMTDPEFN